MPDDKKALPEKAGCRRETKSASGTLVFEAQQPQTTMLESQLKRLHLSLAGSLPFFHGMGPSSNVEE
jgi:hypothetical protein